MSSKEETPIEQTLMISCPPNVLHKHVEEMRLKIHGTVCFGKQSNTKDKVRIIVFYLVVHILDIFHIVTCIQNLMKTDYRRKPNIFSFFLYFRDELSILERVETPSPKSIASQEASNALNSSVG